MCEVFDLRNEGIRVAHGNVTGDRNRAGHTDTGKSQESSRDEVVEEHLECCWG